MAKLTMNHTYYTGLTIFEDESNVVDEDEGFHLLFGGCTGELCDGDPLLYSEVNLVRKAGSRALVGKHCIFVDPESHSISVPNDLVHAGRQRLPFDAVVALRSVEVIGTQPDPPVEGPDSNYTNLTGASSSTEEFEALSRLRQERAENVHLEKEIFSALNGIMINPIHLDTRRLGYSLTENGDRFSEPFSYCFTNFFWSSRYSRRRYCHNFSAILTSCSHSSRGGWDP